MLAELEERLEKVHRERFLPQVTYTRIEFKPANKRECEQGWQSVWGQALRLLYSIAEYPRKAITDPYFLRGIKVNLNELLKAMDVGGDVIVHEWLSQRHSVRDLELRSIKEQGFLRTIMNDEKLDAREKCEKILQVIEGKV